MSKYFNSDAIIEQTWKIVYKQEKNIEDQEPTITEVHHFYRAMRCKRGLCCHAVSVCPSVRHVRGSRQNE